MKSLLKKLLRYNSKKHDEWISKSNEISKENKQYLMVSSLCIANKGVLKKRRIKARV